MSATKPILYGHAGGPNPWKVALLMHELGIQYDHKILDLSQDLKSKPYTDLNPNGREPGAIVEYLVATYDASDKLSYPAGSKEYWQCKQWLMFQMSGPYFGQLVWFTSNHPDPVARDRYKKESERVTMVLNNAPIANGTGYLVGDKRTYGDLAFVPWSLTLAYGWRLDGEAEELKQMTAKYGAYEKWLAGMKARESFKVVWEGERAEAMKKGH